MEHGFYSTSRFAQKASISVRTLRFYDQVGLLAPSQYTHAGHRLYSDHDFQQLQQILALKFLGFSLEAIKRCLQIGPMVLQESLALQKAMMQEKRTQLETVIKAITETEALLQANKQDWDAIVRVIQVLQMQQNNDWQKKYFTDEQLQQMEDLSKQSYTEEQRAKLAEWGKNWSEEDQQKASQQWASVIAELKRLSDGGAEPAGAEAQSLAREWSALIGQFTRGDEGILQGLGKWHQNASALPPEQAPIKMPYGQAEQEFLNQALSIYKQQEEA